MKKKILLALLVFVLAGALWTCLGVKKGVDVSHYNAVRWSNMPGDVRFCYIKMTEGNHFVDSQHPLHNARARERGIATGFYHYFRTSASGRSQFELFNRHLKKSEYDLVPVIDVEDKGNRFTPQGVENLKELCELFKGEYGRYPVIYYGGWKAFYKTFPYTWNMTYWVRDVPGFCIYQKHHTEHLGGCDIDVDYCLDMSRIAKDW